ncbi:MAG: hypothetical protein ACOC95_01165 [Planctomycetota bacterium]
MSQMKPSTFRLNYYDYAVHPIARFLRSRMQDQEILVDAVEGLRRKTPGSDHEATRIEANAEALACFLENFDAIELPRRLRFRKVPRTQPLIFREGVGISVRPELQFEATHRGVECLGGLKLYFAKNDPLTDEIAQHVACLLRRFFEENEKNGAKVMNRFCQVVDVFAGEVFVAPGATSRRLKQIDAACEEIQSGWDRLSR